MPEYNDDREVRELPLRRVFLGMIAAALVIAGVFLAVQLFAPDGPEVWGDADRGLTEYRDGRIEIDVRNATGQQGVAGGGSVTLTNARATLGTQVFFVAAFNGTYLPQGGQAMRSEEPPLEVDPVIRPQDTVAEAYIVPSFVETASGRQMNITVYVDSTFLDALRRPAKIAWGWRLNQSRQLSVTEIRPGLFSDQVAIPDAGRLQQEPGADPEVIVGDFRNTSIKQYPLTDETFLMMR